MVKCIQSTPNPNIVALDSFTSDATYLIDLEANVCSCPHFQHRLQGTGKDCKHLVEAKRQQAFLKASETAKRLSDEQLIASIRHYQETDKQYIAGACRIERARRQQAMHNDAELKAVFS